LEKLKPTHDLAAFKLAFKQHRAITMSAARSARELGYSVADLVSLIEALMPRQFYKSMTSLHNHRQWQDVYHLPHEDRLIYVKFTDHILTEFILLSFKEK
jgi:motility quorum-sensing regulator / GCU-specific mRNA interferase toxin